MVFTYILLPEAQEEYEDSVMWYMAKSLETAEHFVNQVDQALDLISNNPIRGKSNYANFYEIRIKKFPFSIVYYIEKTLNQIVVTSIFHDKRNPERKLRN